MWAILIRRVPFLLLTLFVSSVLIFVATEILPVDVARNMLGQFAPQEAVDALNERLGMDKSPVERYLKWLGRVATGDFGKSTSLRSPVGPLIVKHAINSGILAGAALLLIMPIAFLLGIFAGLSPDKFSDRAISLTSLIATSTPEFVVGVLLLLVFAVKLRLLPGSSALVVERTVLESPSKLILPVLTLAIVDIGYVARMMRASMIEVMRSAYVRAAKLRGVPFHRVVIKHALRSALFHSSHCGDAAHQLAGWRNRRNGDDLRLPRFGPAHAYGGEWARCGVAGGGRPVFCGSRGFVPDRRRYSLCLAQSSRQDG